MASGNKQAIGYYFYEQKSGYDYSHLNLAVIHGWIGDASKNYDANPTTENLERLRQVREVGESSKYFAANYCDDIQIVWQADRESWDQNPNDETYGYRAKTWYGCRVDDCHITELHGQFVSKLAKCLNNYEATPERVLEILRTKFKAVNVKHRPSQMPYGTYAIQTEPDVSAIVNRPWGSWPAPQESQEVAEPAAC